MNNGTQNSQTRRQNCLKKCVKPTRLTSNINVRANLSTFSKVKAEWNNWFACTDKCKKSQNQSRSGGNRKSRKNTRHQN